MEADYIIVGAGAAGCVLAHRLSEDPHTTVLLIERGGRVRNPLVAVPRAFLHTMRRPRYAYHYPTRPLGPDGPVEPWIRGRGEGGSTVINGMLYEQGSPDYYDRLGERCPGWAWSDVRPAVAAVEERLFARADRHRHDATPSGLDRVLRAAAAAARRLGLSDTTDVGAATRPSIAPVRSTIVDGRRVDAAGTFLAPARGRPNLRILSSADVVRLTLEEGRATGVEVRRHGRLTQHRARSEVLVAAGAVESPLLLERSGIGDPEVLARAGIEPRVANPAVGEHVVEQRALTVECRLRGNGWGGDHRLNGILRLAWQALRYAITRRGLLARGPYPLSAAISTKQVLPAHGHVTPPDARVLVAATTGVSSSMDVAPAATLTFTGVLVHPTTTSSVHVGGSDPAAPPSITARYLTDPAEQRAYAELLRFVRAWAATPPLPTLLEDEMRPGPDVSTPEQVAAYARATGAGIYHAVGSCRMGPGDADVVDARLRVHGVTGLRVIDASVFPTPPSAATAGPVMAAAWHAASLILAERS